MATGGGHTLAAKIAEFASVTVVAAAVALFVTTAPGGTHFQTYPYTLSACPAGSSREVDPVNFVFTQYGTGPVMDSQIGQYTNWDANGGTEQQFSSHNSCGPMYAQKATACWDGTSFCTRNHIRVKKTYDDDATLGTTGRGDAHHEDWSSQCNYGFGGHAVDSNGPDGSGFDMGRRALRIDFEEDGFSWWSEFWDNKRNFEQCDGDYAGSSGYTVFVPLRPDAPTAVDFASLRAVPSGRHGVRILWTTGSEVKVLGFNVWRRVGARERRLNSRLIASAAGSGVGGHRYAYLDEGAVAPGVYAYKLQVVRSDGTSRWTGSVKAIVRARPTSARRSQGK